MLLEYNQTHTNVRSINVEYIRPNPYQPRKEMERGALDELCGSIRKYGLMQPIVVRQMGNNEYELIAGERRLRACRETGMYEIPCVVMYADGTDSAILALIENIQRENLNFLEEAEALAALISEHGLTQEEVASRLGKNQSTVANKIRILRLSPEIKALISENSLTERHARALLKLPDEKSRLKALRVIIEKGLNVVKSEELIERMLIEIEEGENKIEGTPKKNIRMFKDIRIFSNTIRQAVDMMKQAGINAVSEKNESDEYIEYKILIPKAM